MVFLGQFFAFFPLVKSESLSIYTPGAQSFLKMRIIDFSRHFPGLPGEANRWRNSRDCQILPYFLQEIVRTLDHRVQLLGYTRVYTYAVAGHPFCDNVFSCHICYRLCD
jgi:hypothetical protein